MDALYHSRNFHIYLTLLIKLFSAPLPAITLVLCPIHSFIAKDAETIKQYAQKKICKTVYVILAQVVDEKIPPFILQMFGTDGTFKAKDVVRRWHHTKQQLER